MQYRSMFVSLPEQLVLHFREWGSGPLACLLIHGFGEGSHAWSEFAPSLGSMCRTIAIDLRGHGDSSWDPGRTYDVNSHTADVSRALATLRLDKLIVIGHSMGGDIAIRLATEAQNRILALVIVDYGPRLDPAAAAKVRSDFNESAKIYSSVSEYASLLSTTRPLASSDVLERFASGALRLNEKGRFQLKCDPEMGRDSASNAAPPAPEAASWLMLEAVKCPTLVVRGQGSAVLSQAVAERMVRSLQDGQLRLVDCAGHGLLLDNPKGFEAITLPFLTAVLSQHPEATSPDPVA
jgi:pimeloyl-ACP methyl ester carboxylesterase